MIDRRAAVSYGEIAFAVLQWTKRQEAGTTRAQVIEAERLLRDLSVRLENNNIRLVKP